MSNRSACKYYIQDLTAGADLSQSARIGLINLLHTFLTMLPPAVMLIQGGITPPNVGSGFPHIVELNGALSVENEACVWQQYKTKKTSITVQLQDEQGAPQPSSGPSASRLAGPRTEAASYQSHSLASNRHAPCLWQASLSWEARCRKAAWCYS